MSFLFIENEWKIVPDVTNRLIIDYYNSTHM